MRSLTLMLTLVLTGCPVTDITKPGPGENPFRKAREKDMKWEGHIYPDRNNLLVSMALGPFANLQDCRDEAVSWISSKGWQQTADYECGYNCRPYSVGLRVCESTRHYTVQVIRSEESPAGELR